MIGSAICHIHVLIVECQRLVQKSHIIFQALALVMGVPVDAVSIKATTTERLGFTGREEGVEAYAAVLLGKD